MRAAWISTELLPLIGSYAWLRVHSAFERALNLRFEAPTAPRLPLDMLTVARAEVGNLPNGVLLADGPRLLVDAVGVGQRVLLADGRLWLPGSPVDLRVARPWDPVPRACTARRRVAGWQRRWAAAWQALEGAAAAGPGSPLWMAAGDRVTRLVDALEHRRLGEALFAAGGLVGLGPGLTPSGDDLLVGMLIGLQCRPPEAGAGRFVAAWGEGILAVADRTTDVSRVYLAWAARGRASQRLGEVADGIVLPGDEGRLARAVAMALHVGNTSGADGLLGLLLGLRMWMDESEENHADAAQGVAQPVSGFGGTDATVEHAGVDEGGQPGVRRDGYAGKPGPAARRWGGD